MELLHRAPSLCWGRLQGRVGRGLLAARHGQALPGLGREPGSPMPQLGLGYAGPCTSWGHVAPGHEPAHHCISLPWVRGSGVFWVRLGLALGWAGSRSKCPVSWAVLEGAAGKDAAARWVRASGWGWGAAMDSVWGRAGANAWHHRADEAALGFCQVPWAVGTHWLSPPHSTKRGMPQGGVSSKGWQCPWAWG